MLEMPLGRHQNLTETPYLYSVKIEGEGVHQFCTVKIANNYKKGNKQSNKGHWNLITVWNRNQFNFLAWNSLALAWNLITPLEKVS